MNITDKKIYIGAAVLNQYLNESPLKPEYDGVPSYQIVKKMLEEIEEAEQKQMAKDFMEERQEEASMLGLDRLPSDHYHNDPVKG